MRWKLFFKTIISNAFAFFPLCLIQHTGSVYVEVPPAADFSQPAGPNLRCRPRLIQVLASRVLKKNTIHHLQYYTTTHTHTHTNIFITFFFRHLMECCKFLLISVQKFTTSVFSFQLIRLWKKTNTLLARHVFFFFEKKTCLPPHKHKTHTHCH